MKVIGSMWALPLRQRLQTVKKEQQQHRSVTNGWRLGKSGEAGLKETPREPPENSHRPKKASSYLKAFLIKRLLFWLWAISLQCFFVVMRILQKHGEYNKESKSEPLKQLHNLGDFSEPCHQMQGLQTSEAPNIRDSWLLELSDTVFRFRYLQNNSL